MGGGITVSDMASMRWPTIEGSDVITVLARAARPRAGGAQGDVLAAQPPVPGVQADPAALGHLDGQGRNAARKLR